MKAETILYALGNAKSEYLKQAASETAGKRMFGYLRNTSIAFKAIILFLILLTLTALLLGLFFPADI